MNIRRRGGGNQANAGPVTAAARSRVRFRRRTLRGIYERLYQAYGPQHWWPAQNDFEVIVGAVLTQNTAWTNVERAITNLRRQHLLSLRGIAGTSPFRLAQLIRPAGYFNVKARRLRNVCDWLVEAGGLASLRRRPTAELRPGLLSVNGIGPETADDILLYAFQRPVFVIDAYTRGLFRRLNLITGTERYEELRAACEAALDPDPALFNEYHALIVRHAKERCAGTPDCRHCAVEKDVTSRR